MIQTRHWASLRPIDGAIWIMSGLGLANGLTGLAPGLELALLFCFTLRALQAAAARPSGWLARHALQCAAVHHFPLPDCSHSG